MVARSARCGRWAGVCLFDAVRCIRPRCELSLFIQQRQGCAGQVDRDQCLLVIGDPPIDKEVVIKSVDVDSTTVESGRNRADVQQPTNQGGQFVIDEAHVGSVRWVSISKRAHLGALVDRRGASCGELEGQRQRDRSQISAARARDAWHVVVVQEGDMRSNLSGIGRSGVFEGPVGRKRGAILPVCAALQKTSTIA